MGKIVGIVIALFMAAALLPSVIGGFADNTETGTWDDAFTAVLSSTNSEDFALTFAPVVGTPTVEVNATPVPFSDGFAATPSFDFVAATGVISLASATSDAGDAVTADYSFTRDLSGGLSVLTYLPLIGLIGIALLFWRRSKRKGGGE